MIHLLADIAPPEQHVPVSALKEILAWVTPFVVAILGAVGCRHYRIKGREEGKNSITTTIDGQVNTKEEPEWVTSPALTSALGEIKQNLRDVWDAIQKERKERGEEVDQIQSRMNAAFHKLDKLDGTVEGVESLTGRLLDLHLGLPQGTTIRRERQQRKAQG